MNQKRLPPAIHTLVLLLSLLASYLFVSWPSLEKYSLQVVAAATIVFFLLKLFNQQKFHHLIPQHASFEAALVTFIFTLLIGATGNTNSIFYPLIYIYLFLLVFSTYTQTAIATTLGLMLYQYLLMPVTTTYVDMFDLISLPIILVFFIFAKQQHEELIKEQQALELEDKTLDQLQAQVKTLSDQLAITQSELNHSVTQLDELKKLLNQLNQEIDKFIQVANNESQKRQAIKLQVIIEEKLKLISG